MINLLGHVSTWLAAVPAALFALPTGAAAVESGVPDGPRVAEIAVAPDAQGVPVSIWLEEGTDLFHPGTPVRLRFRTEEDAYVAILHLDPEGRIELLYPSTGFNAPYVRGGRTHALPTRMDAFPLGRTNGIGYFYIIASPYPLDLFSLRARPGARGGAWAVGGLVRGDPFWALEELTRAIVRDWRYAAYGIDLYSYHVGGRHRYPSYACYDRFAARDPRGGYSYYPSCDHLQRLLVTYPYYYDTRRYRGDRALYLRELDPRHEFKEPVGRGVPPVRAADPRDVSRPGVRGGATTAPPVAAPRQETPRAQPARQRPTLERRTTPSEAERAPARPPQRGESPPSRESAEPRESAPPRENTRAAPQRSESPARAAPRRGESPPRAAPAGQGGSTAPRARPRPPAEEPPRDQISQTAGASLVIA
jgi:hypothetical protein